MLFNSYIFIFLFFPLTLIGYYLFNHFKLFKISNIFLIGMSLWFYGYYNPSYLLIICGSIVINYTISNIMAFAGERGKLAWKKSVFIAGICINIALIFYFKYYDFFLENMNAAFKQSFELKHIILPLGISFFTFQQISYLADSYRGETKGYGFDEYMLFVSFFPQLVAGPIVMHSEMIPQFRNREKRRFIPENFSKGMYIFALGLFKKVIIADTFGIAAEWGFEGDIDSLRSLEAMLVSLAYTFQLYFDFSGYCDMAAGMGSMMNIDIPQNFNSPYKSFSITEFWDRWHMSLTRFLRTYIYIPLGGNRKGKWRTYINIMIVYLISGLWHGANWTFVLWGALHGLFSCLHRRFKSTWEKLGVVTQWFVTFSAVNFLWIIFRAKNIAQAVQFIKRIVSLQDIGIAEELYVCFDLVELKFLESYGIFKYIAEYVRGLNLWIFFTASFFVVLNMKNSNEVKFKPTVGKSIMTAVFMVWSIVSLAGVSTFLYFGF